MITDSSSTSPTPSPEGDHAPDQQPAEGWIQILRARRKKRLREASLVLQSKGIPHAVDSRHNESLLLVPPSAVDRALEQLELYLKENESEGEPPPAAPAAVSSGKAGALGFAALLAIFYALQTTGGVPWTERGLASASHIKDGEWWRVVTALTLHGDFIHLAANLLVGSIFFGLVCQVLGTGIASWATILAGAIGNHVEAWARIGDHRSLGASTAVFGAVGVLCAVSWQHRRRHGRGTLQRLAPLVVGIILLAFFGMSGERTNMLAHCTGLGAGILVGALFARSPAAAQLPRSVQGLLAVSALAFLVLCWSLAAI